MNNLESAILLDNILFTITLTISLIVILIYKRKYYDSLEILIFYMFVALSSYNIMIKPIHDYNIVIFRNAFYHYELIGPISFSDILFGGLSIFYIIKIFLKGKVYKKSLIYYIAVRDFIIGAISIVAFFITYNNFYTVNNELIYYRGIISLLIPSVFLINRNLDKQKIFSIFYILMVIDLIDLVSGYFSTIIFSNYVWQRFGNNVTIIDQDTAYTTVAFYSTVLLISFFKKDNGIINKKNIIALLLIVISLFLAFTNEYKEIFGIWAITILLLLLTNLMNIKAYKRFVAVLLIIVFLPALFIVANHYSTSTGILTRIGQTKDLFNYLNETNYLLHGVGLGGKYKRENRTFEKDLGEIKAIDVIKVKESQGYTRTYQVPLLFIIKISGVLGFLIFIFFSSYILFLLYKCFINSDIWLASSTVLIMKMVVSGLLFLSANPIVFTIVIKWLLLKKYYSYHKLIER